MKTMMVTIDNNTFCSHCGEYLSPSDDVTIRDNDIRHTECLDENLKDALQ